MRGFGRRSAQPALVVFLDRRGRLWSVDEHQHLPDRFTVPLDPRPALTEEPREFLPIGHFDYVLQTTSGIALYAETRAVADAADALLIDLDGGFHWRPGTRDPAPWPDRLRLVYGQPYWRAANVAAPSRPAMDPPVLSRIFVRHPAKAALELYLEVPSSYEAEDRPAYAEESVP